MTTEPQVTKAGVLDMQVCVPATFSDDEIVRFAEKEFPCGTTLGWQIRKEGSERLMGHPERVGCAERDGFVHVMLEA